MPDSAAKRAWVKAILGVTIPEAAGGSGSPSIGPAIAAWRRALERMDGQIAALQSVLRPAPDTDLRDIAEFGLNAMTGSHKVKVQAALMELAAGRGDRGGALRLVESFLAHIQSDPRVAACDANPFGVSISIRGTLTPALLELRAALR